MVVLYVRMRKQRALWHRAQFKDEPALCKVKPATRWYAQQSEKPVDSAHLICKDCERRSKRLSILR